MQISLAARSIGLPVFAIAGFLLLTGVSQADDSINQKLGGALTFYAPFDNSRDAAFALGDPKLYWATSIKDAGAARPGFPDSGAVRIADNEGRFGNALRFERKSSDLVFFKGKHNMRFETNNWNGTVSFWLRVSPVSELATGFCDPIQITPKAWNDAAFFVEFEKRGQSVPFRLGVYPNFNVWNPTNRKWEEIPFSDKPLLEVKDPPFDRQQWTHVLFTFERFNTGARDGISKLYLNGKHQGDLSSREQTFHWDLDQLKIMLGLSYIGFYDDLAIFDRALSDREVRHLFELPNGVREFLSTTRK